MVITTELRAHMKHRRPGTGQPGTDQSSGMFEVPTHWTPAQATAVFEVL